MMKPLIATALAILFAMSSGWAFTACDRNDEPTSVSSNSGNTPDDNDNDNDNPKTPDAMTLNMTIGNSTFTITLADNTTAQAFADLLPLRLNMSELNGNEKYIYLAQSLPSAHIAGYHTDGRPDALRLDVHRAVLRELLHLLPLHPYRACRQSGWTGCRRRFGLRNGIV